MREAQIEICAFLFVPNYLSQQLSDLVKKKLADYPNTFTHLDDSSYSGRLRRYLWGEASMFYYYLSVKMSCYMWA